MTYIKAIGFNILIACFTVFMSLYNAFANRGLKIKGVDQLNKTN
jgi:hypothetical protein